MDPRWACLGPVESVVRNLNEAINIDEMFFSIHIQLPGVNFQNSES